MSWTRTEAYQGRDIVLSALLYLLVFLVHSFARTLPQITVCASPKWNITRPTSDSISVQCQRKCQEGWQKCTYTLPKEKDSSDCLLPHLAFVVDGVNGELRWSCQKGPTLLAHTGMSGTSWQTDWVKAWRRLERFGIRLVEVKWAEGAIAYLNSKRTGMGWFSRKDEQTMTFLKAAGRPGAVIKWVHDNLSQGQPYGTAGCSGGGAATLSPVYWYAEELDPILDYQFISAAAVPWDLEAVCGAKKVKVGRCENRPEKSCTKNSDCGSAKAKCAFLLAPKKYPLGYLWRLIADYLMGSGESCVKGASTPAMRQSSIRYTPGSFETHHLIDFDFGEGGSGFLVLGDDTFSGFTGNIARIYEKIKGPKQWWDNEGYYHCASSEDVHLLSETLSRIKKGLGLKKETDSH